MALYPLENNPEVLNHYIERLGVPRPMLHFVDVYGVSEELLGMVPGLVFAVLFVYPITNKIEVGLRLMSEEQKVKVRGLMKRSPIFFMKQEVENSCGTVALLHALLNNYNSIGNIKDDSILVELHEAPQYEEARESPEILGSLVKENKFLAAAHTETAFEGDSENRPINTSIDLHFSCFVWAWDFCVELDGRKERPLLHGACSSREEFLRETAKTIEKRMSLDTSLQTFSITALVSTST
ncbi:unnamed protein product [Phytomonas sp. Hart1]|nr:unnamed protein product [Phytomonas sp. Hart1]|eukprot:CCW70846.1 unnamed protein product [Phytomonas sp. isolate Hart1]